MMTATDLLTQGWELSDSDVIYVNEVLKEMNRLALKANADLGETLENASPHTRDIDTLIELLESLVKDWIKSGKVASDDFSINKLEKLDFNI